MRRLLVCGSLLAVFLLVPAREGEALTIYPYTNADTLVKANIAGTHACQVLLCKKAGKGDRKAFDPIGYTDEQLQGYVRAHLERVKTDPAVLRGWVRDFSRDRAPAQLNMDVPIALKMSPDLPVWVAYRVLNRNDDRGKFQPMALANLMQIVLEVDRDGDVLQDTLKLYTELGWKVAPSDLGIKDDDGAFLELGQELSKGCCAAPYDTSAKAWQIGLRKIQNWAVKYRGDVQAKDYAAEVLGRPEVKELIPRIQGMRAQRILVIGHSYTMDEHWSSGFSFVGIVEEVFRELNPKVTMTRMGEGGMSAARARDLFLARAVAEKPDRVVIAAILGKDADYAALGEMTEALRKTGAEVMFFDQLHPDPKSWVNPNREKLRAVARETNLVVLEVGEQMMARPDRGEFASLDGTHMRPAYHKWLAGEWLKYLAGARSAAE